MVDVAFKDGNHGPISAAIAGIDAALWDTRARLHGVPLWRELGGTDPRVKVYASGLDTPLDDDAIGVYYRRMAAMGITGGKLKIGLDPDDDLRRIGIMRDALAVNGARPSLMVDVNEYWSPKQAIRRMREIERHFEITWCEEPARRWDYEGLKQVSRAIDAAVATLVPDAAPAVVRLTPSPEDASESAQIVVDATRPDATVGTGPKRPIPKNTAALEHLHHAREVEERARQAVDLVDDHHVDLAAVDVLHEALQRRAVEVPAGEPAIVVARRERGPALGGERADVVVGRLALRVERVEVHVEPLARGLPRVDGAADDARRLAVAVRRGHALSFWRRPKNP
jgi:hypothetical protein